MDLLLKVFSLVVSKWLCSLFNGLVLYNLKYLYLRCFQTKIPKSSCKQESAWWLWRPPAVPWSIQGNWEWKSRELAVKKERWVYSEAPAVTQDLLQHVLIITKSAHLGHYITSSTVTCYPFRQLFCIKWLRPHFDPSVIMISISDIVWHFHPV